MIDFTSAKKVPTDYFSSPSEVLGHKDFSDEQKIEILRQWEYDIRQLDVATEENMAAAAVSHPQLVDVRAALQQLGAPDETHPGGTKFG